MYKYDFIIDGESYKALFLDHFEAADCIDANVHDGVSIIVEGFHFVTAQEILADDDLEWAYRIEMAGKLLVPNASDFKRWPDHEDEMRRLGLI